MTEGGVTVMAPVVVSANGSSAGNTLNQVGVGAGAAAAAAGLVQNVQNGSMGFWVGKNGSVQSTSWGGNGATGGRLKFAGQMAGVAKTAGNAVGALGITVSAVQGYNAFKSNNTNGMVQAGANMVAGGVGFLGPFGWAGSTAYFVGQRIDGWTGASDKFAKWWTGYP